jgi:hypothetical protein
MRNLTERKTIIIFHENFHEYPATSISGCIGYSDTSHNFPQATNFSFIKQYLNQSGINGIQLWGTASTSNIEFLERFQSKALRMIVDAPWYVPNTVIRRDLKHQQLKKKSAATAPNTVLASAHTQTA